MGDTWHGASISCGCVQPMKRESLEEKRWRKRRKGERKRERKEDPVASSSDFRRFNGRSSSGRELKFVYSTRATLQEVKIFHTLGYFHPKGTGFRYRFWDLNFGLRFRTIPWSCGDGCVA